MSTIGKKNIMIPKESSIKIEGANLTVTGPKGTKKLSINDKIFSSKLIENEFQIQPKEKKIDKKIMLGARYLGLPCHPPKKVKYSTERIKNIMKL